MADRVVKVSLVASVAGYVAGMDQAARATTKVSTEAEKLGAKKAAVEGLAKGAIVVGGAITAVGLAALRTGVQYNTLQQTARAALTTLLGSAKDANAQMDRLDEFARSSPFAKQVFISAQQQMLSFGIETRKVIPYLDAVQNAVAAMGGSNADIAGLVAIMAKIKSSAKITAVDLMQFGNRGVDAAAIIGKAMGKTAGQIRSDITDGALDANVALDALAKGMQDKFGGAAAGVKGTFAGSLDRIKAAWRDFSSELAKPLVDPHGGGMLIDLFNMTADLMRAFTRLPEPIKATASAGVGLIGVVALLGGTAVLAIPKIVAFRVSLETLKTVSPAAAGGINAVGGAMRALPWVAFIGLAHGATAQLSDMVLQVTGARKSVDGLASSFASLGAKKTIDDALGFGGGNQIKALTSAGWFSDFAKWGQQQQDIAGSINPFTGMLRGLMDPAWGNLKEIDKTLAQMASSGRAKQAGEGFAYLAAQTDGSKDAIARLKTLLPEYAAAQKEASKTTTEVATAQKEASKTTTDVATAQDVAKQSATGYSAALAAAGDAVEDATKAQKQWLDAVAASDAAFIDLGGAYQDLVKQNQAVAEETAKSSGNAKATWQDFYDGVSVSIDQYIAKLESQVTAQANWETNMILLSGRVSAGMMTELAKMGPQAAPLVAQFVEASDAELGKIDGLWQQKARQATTTFASTLDQAGPLIAAASAQLGAGAAREIAAKLANGTATVQQIMNDYKIKIEATRPNVTLNTSGAYAQLDDLTRTRSMFISVRYDQSSDSIRLGRAGGGILPGAPSTRDNMVINAASGEFVVNAAQTARNRRLLEFINSGGHVPGFAAGGFVQPQYASSSPVSSTAPSVAPVAGATVNVSIVNPVVRDLRAEAWDAAQVVGMAVR